MTTILLPRTTTGIASTATNANVGSNIHRINRGNLDKETITLIMIKKDHKG